MNRDMIRHHMQVKVDMGLICPRGTAVISNTGVVLKLELDHHPCNDHPELIPGGDFPDRLLDEIVALNDAPVELLAGNIMVVSRTLWEPSNHEATYYDQIEDTRISIAEKLRSYAVDPNDKVEQKLEFHTEHMLHLVTAACRDYHLFRSDPDGVFGEKL